MSAHDEDRIQHLLRQALPPVEAEPVPTASLEPTIDLWPRCFAVWILRLPRRNGAFSQHRGLTGRCWQAWLYSQCRSRSRSRSFSTTCDLKNDHTAPAY